MATINELDRVKSSRDLLQFINNCYSNFHQNCDMLVAVAKKCEEYNLLEQAETLYNQSLHLKPTNPFLKESLRHLYYDMIDRWHFLMLNDVQRNAAFFKAIIKSVRERGYNKVMDIGSGTGVLSMMAVQAGADQVYACEMSSTMISLCKNILEANNMSDKVKLIHGLSTDLTSLDVRVPLVVTEVFDAGLLGELIIPTLRHAWEYLLVPENGKVIPLGATVYVCAIECNEVTVQSSLTNQLIIDKTRGLILRGSCKLNESKDQLIKEPYSCERLSLIKGNFKYLSGPQVALYFNFNNPQVPLPSNTLKLPIINNGTVDAIVAWFELHLDDTVSFSTGPSSNSSWEQAIFPQYDLWVDKDQHLTVEASCTDSHLVIETSTDNIVPPEKIYFVERNELKALNDVKYIETIILSLMSLLSTDSEWIVLDLMSLPIISLMAADKIDFILLANCQLYYKSLIGAVIDSNKLEEKTSISPMTSAVTWDIVLYDIITPQGTLDTESLHLLKLVSLDTIHLCNAVQIHVVGMSSPDLRAHSCVLGTIPTLGFDIAQFINKYQVTHYTDVDLGNFPYKGISNTVTLTLPQSFDVETEVSMTITQSESLTGFAYWFTLGYYGNHSICTGPNAYEGSHWHQAVFLLPQDRVVITGQEIAVQIKIQDGVLDIRSDKLNKSTLPPHNTIPTYNGHT